MIDPNNIVDLWKAQRLPPMAVDVDSTIRRATFMQRKVRYRNLIEYIAAAVLAAWVTVFVARSESTQLIKLGVVLTGVSGMGVATALWRCGSVGNPPMGAPTGELLRWHHAELLRQRDLLLRVPVWYLGPFVPGLVLTFLGAWLAHPDERLRIVFSGGIVVAVFVSIAFLNLRSAKNLDEQLDSLERQLAD